MSTVLISVVAGFFVLASPLLLLAGQADAVPGKIALVLTSPFGPDARHLVLRSGLTPVVPVGTRIATFVQIDSASDIEALEENGVWLVRDGRRILALCGVSVV